MEPTEVRISRMDSRRPGVVVTLLARHLGIAERLWRSLGRMTGVTVVGLLVSNFALLVIPVPHFHLCGLPVALVLGPIVGVVTWQKRALLAPAEISCPKCGQLVQVPADLPGWPARFNCVHCSIMVELTMALPHQPATPSSSPR